MDYTIKEINGRLYKVLPNGGRLLHIIKAKPIPGVYMVTQLSTGMKYVGSTINIKQRRITYEKPSAYRSSFLRSVDPSDLKFEVLCEYSSIEKKDLLIAELQWIAKMNTIHPNGFNLKCPVTQQNLSNHSVLCYTGRKWSESNGVMPERKC